MPTTASIKSSGAPNVSTSGRTTGIARARANAPTRAPTASSSAPRPKPGPPRLFSPSRGRRGFVAAVVPSPGRRRARNVMFSRRGDDRVNARETQKLHRLICR